MRIGHLFTALALALVGAACVTPSGDSTTSTSEIVTSTTSASSSSTSSTVATHQSTSTTVLAAFDTLLFSIEKGNDGVTFQEDGDPPSGPSSFAVLADGSVAIADTMAASRGEPRVLHFDRTGRRLAILDLASFEVASIVDVATDGTDLAVLDVFVATGRYRVLVVSIEGQLLHEISIPDGFHFEDGLSGLVWDDEGILLEFELGVRYARLALNGGVVPGVFPSFGGSEVRIVAGEGRTSTIRIGSSSFDVDRPSDLGGVSLIGVAPDGSIVLALDEVDLSGPAIRVHQHIRRYTRDGMVVAEVSVDVGDQFIEIARPWELGADGSVLYLAAHSGGITITPETELSGP